MKEYGGYLPFEFKEGEEYYRGENVVALNCARNAIVYSVFDGGYEKIYIPFYMCNTVKDTLMKYNIDYAVYHIDEKFNPIGIALKKNECMLYANYYGLFSDEKIDGIVKQYCNVILDNTQAFFAKPNLSVYNVYSCRKFIGVCDGAYVIKKGIKHIKLKKDESYHRIQYLFKCIEKSTDEAYEDSLQVERELNDSTIKEMSLITHKLLQMANYNYIIQKRKNNFKIFCSELNSFQVKIAAECVPMIYPYWCESKKMRDLLIKNHVYIPQWWNYLLGIDEINEFEEKLVNNLLPLPIDQRYETNDIMHIVNLIRRLEGKN